MGVVLLFRKPGTRMFPIEAKEELYKLSWVIREIEIRQRRYQARGQNDPKSLNRQLLKARARMRELLLNNCTRGSATNATTALILYGRVNHLVDVESITYERDLIVSVVQMRIVLDQILERLFLWSYLNPSDCLRIKGICEHLPKVEEVVNAQLLTHTG